MLSMNPERKLKQDVFIRVCKDSGFMLSSTDAAILAARVLGCHPLDIAFSLDMDVMEKIAKGKHPVCKQGA